MIDTGMNERIKLLQVNVAGQPAELLAQLRPVWENGMRYGR